RGGRKGRRPGAGGGRAGRAMSRKPRRPAGRSPPDRSPGGRTRGGARRGRRRRRSGASATSNGAVSEDLPVGRLERHWRKLCTSRRRLFRAGMTEPVTVSAEKNEAK